MPEHLQNRMHPSSEPRQSQLFVVKIWLAETANGEWEWRGQIQSMASRERQYFREWEALLHFLQMQLRESHVETFSLSNQQPTQRLGLQEKQSKTNGGDK